MDECQYLLEGSELAQAELYKRLQCLYQQAPETLAEDYQQVVEWFGFPSQ